MNREQAIKYIHEHTTEYFNRDKSGKGFICPICGSGGGANGTGITTKDNIHFTCWTGCFTNADLFEIVGKQNNLYTFNEQMYSLCNFFKLSYIEEVLKERETRPSEQPEIKPQNFEPSKEFFKQANANLSKTNYYRGISLETLNKYLVGYLSQWKHPKAAANDKVPFSPRLIIPNDSGGYLARDTRLNLTPIQKKYKIGRVLLSDNTPMGLFNSSALLESEQPLYIVEGELDALSIIDAGGQAVALCSTSNAKKFLDFVKENKPAITLIISLDSDEAGNKAAEIISAGLNELNISFYRHDLPVEYKDANEFLMKDKEGFIKWVIEGKTPIAERESISYKLTDFLATVKKNREGRAIPTGFENLDSILDGGLYPSLIFLGAITSAGKTTLITQIADNIARAGYGVLFFSLEMSTNEIIAKFLSRASLILDIELNGTTKHAKTTRGILKGIYNDIEKDLLSRAIKQYKEFGKNISIVEGVGNVGIKEIADKVKEYTRTHDGRPPVVIIDYIQIIAPYDIRMSDKQNTDKAVLELKRLSRDFQVPVIGISSFNRENYNSPVNLSCFKESGAIEYSSDVLIGLQYLGWDYVKGEKESDRQQRLNTLREQIDETTRNGGGVEVQLKILKNRNGRRGSLRFESFPMFNYFRARGEY